MNEEDTCDCGTCQDCDIAYHTGYTPTQIKAMVLEIKAWRDCAMYDATMQGPVFKGWNQSQLGRCRDKYIGKKK